MRLFTGRQFASLRIFHIWKTISPRKPSCYRHYKDRTIFLIYLVFVLERLQCRQA